MIQWLRSAREWARTIKRDVVALWYAARDPRVPWYAKATAACVVAYALSPVDLIPDFVPILGYVDDLVIVPLGIVLAVRMIPPELLLEFRRQAEAHGAQRKSYAGAVFVALVWLAATIVVGAWLIQWLRTQPP